MKLSGFVTVFRNHTTSDVPKSFYPMSASGSGSLSINAANNKTIPIPTAIPKTKNAVYKIAGKKVLESWDFHDSLGGMMQMGIVPSITPNP